MQMLNNDKVDWRIQTTAYLGEDWVSPWSELKSPKGARLTVVSIIQLTKKKRLTIPIPNASAVMLNAAAQAYKNAHRLRLLSEIDKTLKSEVCFHSDEDALDYVERMIEAIVLAFSAIEAFANESVPTDYVYERFNKTKSALETVGKENIERFLSLDEKLTIVLPEILGCQTPKSSRCWQNYKLLKNTRDRIIHMKTEDRKSSGPELETIWKAIIMMPAPHLSAIKIIDHFINVMGTKPQWRTGLLNGS